MTSNKIKATIAVTLLVLVIIVTTAIMFGNTSLSVISEDTMFEGMSCDTSDDCYDSLINSGFPKAELDAQLEEAKLICVNNVCGAKR